VAHNDPSHKWTEARDISAAYRAAIRPAGEWNDLEFDITKWIGIIRLNGQVLDSKWRVKAPSTGPKGITLQRWAGSVDFKEIYVQRK
jgi:hypothetical protein